MADLALSVPFDEFALAELAGIGAEAEHLGYTAAWSSETDGLDGFGPLALLASTTSLQLGTAIINVFTRGPATLAQSAATLGEAAPGRFILGIGSGSQPIVERWNGGEFRYPVTRVREMTQFLRQALAGERVVFAGKTLHVDGFRLTRPPAQPIPIYIAALRPGMLAAAGELGDGVILNWLGAEDVPACVREVRAAAERAGRDPASVRVTARLMLLVDHDDRSEAAQTAMRRHVSTYLNVPVYREFHRWLGREPALGQMWHAWEAGDRKAALAALPQSVVDTVIIHGSPGQIRDHIGRYLDAGIDTAFLSLSSVEPDMEKRRQTILGAIRAFAPKLAGAR